MSTFLVVGLGNPGSKYEETPHNIGFEVVDRIARDLGPVVFQNKFEGLLAKLIWEGHTIYLLKPQTFMNLSGQCVQKAVHFFKIDVGSQLAVIYDDLDTPLSNLRIRKSGGSGGHNGIGSVIEALGTKEFTRFRIGIGRSEQLSPEVYVLKKWSSADRPKANDSILRSSLAVQTFFKRGIDTAMNLFNRKDNTNES